ncbi:MAG: DUF3102 domain-containing protein [Treponema sp.]|nr:DUF3102 domain-containing protein [Treponema sp.]
MAKYDGLIYIPSSDPNFISGIQGLTDLQLSRMLEKLYELDETESGHKGRIKAVEKEMNSRGETSTEVVAMDKQKADIEMVERLYGDNMPYDKNRLEDSAKFYLAQTAQSLFETGKIFLRLKAHEGHGEFMTSLERIGVPQTTANYAMAAVIKFGSNSPPVGNLGITKIKMLTVFDEEDIKKYVDGGPLGNIPHDDVENMSKRELQEAIRKERKKHQHDVDSREKSIKQKEAKINELDEQLRYQQPLTEKEMAAKRIEPMLSNLQKELFTNIECAIYHLGAAKINVEKARQLDGVTFPQLEEWRNKDYEQMAIIKDLFEDLDDALGNIYVDKGDVK